MQPLEVKITRQASGHWRVRIVLVRGAIEQDFDRPQDALAFAQQHFTQEQTR